MRFVMFFLMVWLCKAEEKNSSICDLVPDHGSNEYMCHGFASWLELNPLVSSFANASSVYLNAARSFVLTGELDMDGLALAFDQHAFHSLQIFLLKLKGMSIWPWRPTNKSQLVPKSLMREIRLVIDESTNELYINGTPLASLECSHNLLSDN
jgi:hypothetical protein